MFNTSWDASGSASYTSDGSGPVLDGAAADGPVEGLLRPDELRLHAGVEVRDRSGLEAVVEVSDLVSFRHQRIDNTRLSSV